MTGPGGTPAPQQVQQVVRAALDRLGESNGHHAFEELCVHLARRVISERVTLATGPVSSGGDQGRDAETLWTAAEGDDQVVLIVTTQRGDLPAKFRSDLEKVFARGPAPARVAAFCTAGLDESRQHDLQDWALKQHDVRLQVWDGPKIAGQLATGELFWIAEQYLHLPRLLGPGPYAQVSDLLEAQLAVAGQASPGAVLDRRVQRVPGADTHAVTPAELPLLDLAERGAGRPVLLTGEPGTGKSTAGRTLFEHLAGRWLEHHRGGSVHAPPPAWVPLLVRARDLLGEASSFSDMLRRAACRYARPTGPVPAELFAAAVYRARWLVVVDGLDEIQQDDARQELITLLAAQGRGQSGHRLVVLARPLAPSELRPLIDAGFLPFSLPRFTRDELHEFGRRRTGGEVFERIEDPYLIEMLKVPLFAELALSVAARGDGPVPANRLDLIEAFLAGLRSASSRSALLSPAQSDDLLAELAVSTVSTVGAGGSLLGPAAQWCRARGIGLSPEEIRHHLIRTGVLVAAGDELVFAHHALAEYLAARRRSAALPSGDSAVLELVGELRARSRTNLVTYTVILHLRRHPVLVVRVIRALLAEDTATAKNRFRGPSEQARGGVLAAAELILDGVAVDDPIRNWVINRLVAHAVGKDDEDRGESVDVLDVLARFGSYPELGQRLREIVTSGNADVRARCRAATHLALGGDRATAESELEGLLPNAGSAANALTIIDTLAGLRDGTGDLARESLERWGDDPATEPWTLVSVAERLADLGDREKAAELGRRAFAADRGDSGGHVGRAAELLLALDPAAADQLFEAFRSSGRRNPFEQAELALAFAEAGAVGPAVALAREALADPQLSSFDEALQWAVDAWFFSAEPTEAELVGLLRALPSRARRETLQALPREHAAYGWRHRLLSELLDEPDHSGLDLVDAVRIARDPLSPESTTALLRPVTRHPRRGARALAKVGAFPPDVPVPAEVLPELLALVNDPATPDHEATTATRVLVAAGPEWSTRGVEAFLSRPTVADADLVPVAQRLAEVGDIGTARVLAWRVLAGPLASLVDRRNVFMLAEEHFPPFGTEAAVEEVLNNPWLGADEFLQAATFLRGRGLDRAAGRLLVKVLADPAAEPRTRLEALGSLTPADVVPARIALEGKLRDAPSAAERTQLQRMLGWLAAG